MALGDIYKITDKQVMFNKPVANVYFYRQNFVFLPIEGNEASVLLAEWKAVVLPTVRALQNSDLTHVEYSCENLFAKNDRYSELATDGGSQYTEYDALPVFTAAALRLGVLGGEVKDGAKRIAGIPESAVVDGVITGGDWLGRMNALSAALESPLETGLILRDATFYPVVVKRVKEATPDGGWEYRLPLTVGEAVYQKVVNVLYSVIMTSQISRKG